MATAVLDLELTKLLPVINGLDAYQRALVLIRYKEKPIGKAFIPVINGCIITQHHYTDLVQAAGSNLTDSLLDQYLEWQDFAAEQTAPGATIAVCTRNRPDDLRRCLAALMNMPDDGQEFLVIDNCPSTDATREIVALHKRIRYVLETRPGLNIARNRALLEASNEVVIFTDDDATPDINWLRKLVRNFNSPLVACVTGLTMPLELESDGQEAFEKYSPFGKNFKRAVYSAAMHNPLSTGEIGAGANMALRRSVQKTVGLFDEALDAGTLTQSGGDHEFFTRILLAGYQIVYEPEALSWHRHRRTMEETEKAIKGYGIGVYAFWTRLLLMEGELTILKFPWYWFKDIQFRNLVKALLGRKGSQPLSLVLAELRGCCIGPFAYLKARRRLKNKEIIS